MKNWFANRCVLLIVLGVFVLLKLPHLSYSFYWDESWPYASGVKHMYEHGPSLMPGAIDGELSRGHPLMFHFLASMWMKLFGSSNFVMHSFPLFIAVLFLIAIYEIGLQMFDKRVAITALLLIAFQQAYFVQSSLVLLELLLAFLGFISIYFYVTKRYVLTAITLTMLFYTKESGMVLGLVLVVDAAFVLFKSEIALKDRVYNMLSLLIPILLIGVFFLMQKKISGWYVLPLYSNGLETSWDSYYEKIRSCCKVYFRDDVRRYFYAGILTFCVLADITNKKIRFSKVLLLAPFAFLLSSDSYHWLLPKPVLLICFAVFFIWIISTVFKAAGYSATIQKKYALITGSFILIFTAYTAINKFFIDRYMLITLIPLLFLVGNFADRFIKICFTEAIHSCINNYVVNRSIRL